MEYNRLCLNSFASNFYSKYLCYKRVSIWIKKNWMGNL